MRTTLPMSLFGPEHDDFDEIRQIETAILAAAGGNAQLTSSLGKILRDAIDIVIDTPDTKRCDYEELEKTEKTYLGTRVEIKVRAFLGFPKGRLDLRIGSHDVDIKFTVGPNWTIPPEAMLHVCILIAADEERARCYMGLLKIRTEHLNVGRNRDSKATISVAGFKHIRWLVEGEPYPPNFWRSVPKQKREAIFSERSGTARLVALFREIQETPIHRSVIEAVAQQKDYMKRLRQNGGARDPLAKEGIVLLSGKYDSAQITTMYLARCDSDSFISKKMK